MPNSLKELDKQAEIEEGKAAEIRQISDDPDGLVFE